MSTTTTAESSLSGWERGFDKAVEWIPYVTLAIGLILGLLQGTTWSDRWMTLGLAGLAAGWTLFMFTLAGERRGKRVWMAIYFAGMLVFGVLLMAHQPIFFVYLITGFVHAFLLKPLLPLAFVGVGLTSLVINGNIIFPNPTPDAWWTYGIIVVIQTIVIGLGIIGGEKISEASEERRQTVIELEAALQENAGLHAQLVAQAREAGVSDERQRMAREIHDTIAQGLTGVITQLEAASLVKTDPDELQRRLDNATRLARDSLAESRRAMGAVIPAPLENRHLSEALADEAARWSSLHHIPVEVTTTGEGQSLHPEVDVTLLRVAQEALANVAKHAEASRVWITLSYMGDLVGIDVRDDGIGIDAATRNGNTPGGGFGLTAMRQRVEMLAGSLEIESDTGAGTTVSVTLPAISLASSRV